MVPLTYWSCSCTTTVNLEQLSRKSTQDRGEGGRKSRGNNGGSKGQVVQHHCRVRALSNMMRMRSEKTSRGEGLGKVLQEKAQRALHTNRAASEATNGRHRLVDPELRLKLPGMIFSTTLKS